MVCRCFFFLQSIKVVFEERKQMVAVIVALFQGGKKPLYWGFHKLRAENVRFVLPACTN